MKWKRTNCRSQRILCFWVVVFCAQLSFGSLADEFKSANQLYDAGKFTEAIAAYEKIEPKSAHIFYNLGNSCFRANQLGKAILNYERARRLAPRDPDILANLKFAEERLGVDAANASPKAIKRFLHSVVFSRTPNEWSGYELAGLLATVIGIGLWVWLPSYRTVWMTLSVAAFLCCAATAGLLAWRVADQRHTPEAIVLLKQADARFAPLTDATVHFKLAEGMRVAVREDRGQWLFVERADGQQGWVPANTVERLGLY